jgi:hypothetical protein
MWIVYVSQNLLFGGGLLGITYGIMSTSWDPSREGSVSIWWGLHQYTVQQGKCIVSPLYAVS